MIDTPWYYNSMETAVEEATKHFKWDLYHGTAYYSGQPKIKA